MKLQHPLVIRISSPAEFKTVGTQRINTESLLPEVMIEKSKPTSVPWVWDRAPYIRDTIEWKIAFPTAYGTVLTWHSNYGVDKPFHHFIRPAALSDAVYGWIVESYDYVPIVLLSAQKQSEAILHGIPYQ